MEINGIYSCDCADMNSSGNGVCFERGDTSRHAVFVRGAVTGDVLDVRITEDHGKYLCGEIERLVTPSDNRADSVVCPVFEKCGCCDFLHITDSHELELKRRFVEGAFRSCGMRDVTINDTVRVGGAFGYRNKAVLSFGPAMNYGYYSERTHTLVPCAKCPLYPDIFSEIFAFAASRLKAAGIGNDTVRAMYLRIGTDGNAVLCFIVTRRGAVPKPVAEAVAEKFSSVSGVIENINISHNLLDFKERPAVLCGSPDIKMSLCGIGYTVAPDAFFQINTTVAGEIFRRVSQICAGIGNGAAARVLDLYCGAGTIALTVAKSNPALSVTGVELVASAVENAKTAAAANGIKNAVFIKSDAVEYVKRAGAEADAVIIDPPRGGCGRGLLEAVADAGVKRVIYVSCNPATLARDVRLLHGRGYVVDEATPFDMFPKTGSVETVCVLSRLPYSV